METVIGIIVTAVIILWAVGSLAGQLFGYDVEGKK